MKMIEYTSIRINTRIRDKLKSMGMKGESYDDILTKIIKFYEVESKNK